MHCKSYVRFIEVDKCLTCSVDPTEGCTLGKSAVNKADDAISLGRVLSMLNPNRFASS